MEDLMYDEDEQLTFIFLIIWTLKFY